MCGATAGGVSMEGVNLANESVIQGVVTRAAEGGNTEPVGNAYVRLLDRTGEFTAEVPTSVTGQFRFFAAPGRWTLRTLAPNAQTTDRDVVAAKGEVAEVAVTLVADVAAQ